ncbi:MAG: DUF1828 domain-containing protein [Candidatus Aminicenantes bacterium]|nr:DUF1828 domain-containing protein [Candidatus Aminicenantes bacterium]
MDYLSLLKEQFNNRIAVKEKRTGIWQIYAPFYHEDGDMVEIFLEKLEDGNVRVSDYGMTVMRLSYSYELDTPKKMEIFGKILSENQVNEKEGSIYIDTRPGLLYGTITQFAQTIAKVSNMRLYKKEVIRSMFYELVKEFVGAELAEHKPRFSMHPLPDRPELEVDYSFNDRKYPLYLFAVKDDNKAKMVTISCLEFLNAGVPFTSAVVHEEFESLSRTDKKLILSRTDKQFPTFADFKMNSNRYISRELSH